MSPDELASTGFLALVNGVVHAPADCTCGPNTYEYFVVSRELSPAVYAVHTVADSGFGPHTPVRLLFRASPRSMMVRCLVKLGASPPASRSGRPIS